jgi:hypothetical protein
MFIKAENMNQEIKEAVARQRAEQQKRMAQNKANLR